MNAPDELPVIPELDPDFELVRVLGRGNTSVIYLARERELGREVAIKLIRPGYLPDEESVARLVREARTLGKLQHPGIVMLLGTRRLGERGLALILQFVPGITLRQRIDEGGPLPFDEAERILGDLGRALAYAHSHRIVHRDIKPGNIYLDESCDVARLADFGIARSWDPESGLTFPGTSIGTPTYMSPEQVDGKTLDGRSDLYSLGLVGYELLTGRKPWARESLYGVIYKQKHEALPPMSSFRPGIPENLRRAVEGTLRKDRDERWPDAAAFLAALEEGSVLPREGAREGKRTLHGDPEPGDEPWPPRELEEIMAEYGVAAPGEGPAARDFGAPLADPPSDPRPEPWAEPTSHPGARARMTPLPEAAHGATRDGPWWTDRRVARSAAAGALVALGFLLLSPDGRSPSEESEPPAGVVGETAFDPGTSREAGPPPGAADDLPAVLDRDLEADALLDPLPEPALEEVTEAETVDPEEGGGARVLALDGDGQEAAAGMALPNPLVVRVVDGDGDGVEGVPVAFEVISGGGSAEPLRGITGGGGFITATWTLGAEGREQLLLARVDPPDDGEGDGRFGGTTAPEAAGALGGAGPFEILFRSTLSELPTVVDASDAREEEVAEDPIAEDMEPDEAAAEADAPPEPTSRDDDPPLLTIEPSVLAGGTFSCSLPPGGEMICWGANDGGQLGDGTRSGRSRPAASVAGGPFAVASSGLGHVCALDVEGRAFCWGSGEGSRNGGSRDPSSPEPVSESLRFSAISSGVAHSCGLTPAGTAHCWGRNDHGQLGDGSREARGAPVEVQSETPFVQIHSGWRHSCALDSGGFAYCWGDNGSGQLGSGSPGGSTLPRLVIGGYRFRTLSAGSSHTCGIVEDGAVLCWGSNGSGQLGDGSGQSRSAPRPVAGSERFNSVAAGGLHSCGIAEGGAAFCWGANHYGQLGDGTTVDRSTPVRVSGQHRFSRIEALGAHTCGRSPEGDLLCWGYNLEGQLGDGTRENRSVPTPVASSGP